MFIIARKTIKICLYALLIIIGIDFSVVNRSKIVLTLFPLPYEISTPLFIFAIAVFIVGILMGWAITRFKTSRFKRQYKTAATRITALENELAAVRAEKKLIKTV